MSSFPARIARACAVAGAFAVLASLAPARPAVAQTPAPAPTPDPLAYDDPGMHFRAPDGWKRVDLGNTAPAAGDNGPPAAVFTFGAGKRDARTIFIQIQPFEGTLEGLESSKESELRGAADGTFVDGKTRVTLANGMPAYFLKTSQPGAAAGNQVRRYDYVIYDLTRGIDVAYVGRYGDFDENDVKRAFASLSVVVYPRTRR